MGDDTLLQVGSTFFSQRHDFFTIQAAIPGIGSVFGGIYLCAGETSVLVE